MIELTDVQRDALIEICNVGMSKAAKQLSILLNSRIEITIPKINLTDVNDIAKAVAFQSDQVLSYVYQTLEHDLQGRALLIFHREQTSVLTQSIIGNAPKMSEKEIRACEQEAMMEVGNIIITSCLSAIMRMLSEKVNLSVPFYGENMLSLLIKEEVQKVAKFSNDAIIMATRLETPSHSISGSLILILTRESIERLIRSVTKLLQN